MIDDASCYLCYFTLPSNTENKQHGRLLIMYDVWYDVKFSHNTWIPHRHGYRFLEY